jgi:class 3 adenylate cyclase
MGSRIARFEGDAKHAALEEYVPGAIAEQLATGGSLESGERNVTILFVDIWSALGDTTNLAARLQGLTRDLDVNVIIDEATKRSAGHSAAMFRAQEGQAIRGRGAENIHVY